MISALTILGTIFFQYGSETGIEPVISLTEKSCIESYYRQVSMNIKIKSIILIISSWAGAVDPLGLTKLALFLKLQCEIFYFS